MASIISALTSGGGGISMTGDASGILNLNSNGSTVVAVTATGATVTGTLAVSGGVTLTTTLPVLQGGTGVTTSTGTGAGVHSVGPSISSAVMTTMASSVITSGTAVATTSGTSIDFTSIPSWVKRITVMMNGISTNGTSPGLIQIGSGSVTTTGYISSAVVGGVGAAIVNSTSGFIRYYDNSTFIPSGLYILCLVGSNIWAGSYTSTLSTSYACYGAGAVTLAGVLDRLRFTTVNGTDTFDAGSVNILYE